MNREKMLYHAKHNGALRFQSYEIVDDGKNSQIYTNIRFLIDGAFLTWETSDMWSDYKAAQMYDAYDEAWHEYKITKEGEVLLAIYRLEYIHRTDRDSEKHMRRIEEFAKLLEESKYPLEWYNKSLTKKQVKAVRYACTLIFDKPKNDSVLPSTAKVQPLDDIDLDELSLSSMFNMSVGLGAHGTNETRHEDYVLKKCVEELGELALEINIDQGLSYKEPGKDGVKGEAVDLAICALDMFALQCHNMTSEEIEREFLSYMVTKLNKWRDTLR